MARHKGAKSDSKPAVGPKRKCQPRRPTSGFGGEPEHICSVRAFPLLTRSGQSTRGLEQASHRQRGSQSPWLDVEFRAETLTHVPSNE
jgi:hypothetical protein